MLVSVLNLALKVQKKGNSEHGTPLLRPLYYMKKPNNRKKEKTMESFLVCNKIRNLRLKINWPQWKLSLASEIAESRISILEQGAPPRRHEMEKIAEALHTDVSNIWPKEISARQSS